ncbi:hypothetical protein ACLBWT_00780 [Paenibacillus sp. D51F]
MDKFLEMMLGEAYKLGLKKLFGVRREERNDGGGCGCFLWILLWAVGIPIAIHHGSDLWVGILIAAPFVLALFMSAPGCVTILILLVLFMYFAAKMTGFWPN